jgi:sulfatase-like protein
VRTRLLTLGLAVIVLGVAAFLLSRGSDDGEAARPQGTVAAKVSGKPPIVFLILDELPVDSLLGPNGKIDATRFPNFAALAAVSTWFPNSSTVYDSTPKAVPAIMDGRSPFKGEHTDTRDHPHSIYTALGKRGYRIVDSEEATAICPRRYCPHARKTRPGILAHLNRGRPERLEAWIRSIRSSRRPTLWLKHALFPHGPWMFLPSGKQARPTVKDPVPGLNSPRGFHDRSLTDHNHQRYMLQLGYTDRELGHLLARMDKAGILDRSLLVVTADHGMAFEVGVSDRRRVTESNVDEIATQPLFIKAPGQRKGRVDRSYVRTIDILPTLADILNIRLGYHVDGRSAFSRATRRRRFVRLPTRSFDRIIKIGARSWERRRRANIRHRTALFGTGIRSLLAYGDPWASVYRIGPQRDLVGRPLASLRVTGRGKARASIAAARLTRSVSLSSTLLPTQIGGRITGGRRGAHRDVAVAVNGTVWAVGRTFYLRGSRSESFDAIVPDTALLAGRNDVRVFEVGGRGRSRRLVPLGRN